MIDFRSDTVTTPTNAMRQAMAKAEVGDDVYGDDPTVNRLEQEAAKILGKEAALFVPSGTMGNQIAIMVHTNPGDEIILGKGSHIKNYEVGAAALLSSANFHVVEDAGGALSLEAVKKGIRSENIHYPKTSLILSETAHSSGEVAALKTLEKLHDLAKKQGIKHHLDGARIFNAAHALKVDIKAITSQVDSVMFCLSKGLSAPIGSMLVGDQAFINKARKYRKLLGGGMRQVGIIASAGLIALTKMRLRLGHDHDNAQYLRTELKKTHHFTVKETGDKINMVFIKSDTINLNHLTEYLKPKGILLGGYKGEYMRLMTHNDIDKAAIDTFLNELKTYIATNNL